MPRALVEPRPRHLVDREPLPVDGAAADPVPPAAAPRRAATPRPGASPPWPHRRRGWALAGLLLVGLLLRVEGLGDEPLAFHPARQYRSAVIARSMYLDATRPADDPARQNAAAVTERMGVLEPPIIEAVAAGLYRVTGDELWVPRLLNIGIWLIGAAALWSILGRLGSSVAQFVGTGLFVVLPMGVAASRAFQPDALMVGSALVAMALMLRADERPGRGRTLGAAAAGGVSLLVKPMIGPLVLGWWLALIVTRQGWRGLLSRAHAAAAAVLVLPTVAFYAYGALTRESVGGWMGGSLLPELFTQRGFYEATLRTIDRAVPLPLVGLALLATLVLDRRPRALLGALWAGYVVFDAAVNYRTATHDYYHLPLVAIVALALGLGGGVLVRRMAATSFPAWLRTASCAVVLAALVGAAALVGGGASSLEPPHGRGPEHVAANARIGDLTGHSDRILAVTPTYGADLTYDGDVVSAEYPSPADASLLAAQGDPVGSPATIIEASGARWFAVTDVHTFAALPELQAELRAHHRLVERGEGWALWELEDVPG